MLYIAIIPWNHIVDDIANEGVSETWVVPVIGTNNRWRNLCHRLGDYNNNNNNNNNNTLSDL